MQNFESVESLAAHMFEKLDKDAPASVVAKKDFAVSVVKELLAYDNVILSCANINSGNYDREYLVSLQDDTASDCWYAAVEPIYSYKEDRYFGANGYVLLHEDVSSKALLDMQNNENIEMSGYDWFAIGGKDHIAASGHSDPGQIEKSIENLKRRITNMEDVLDEMKHFRALFAALFNDADGITNPPDNGRASVRHSGAGR